MLKENLIAVQVGWRATGILLDETIDFETAVEDAQKFIKQEMAGKMTTSKFNSFVLGRKLRILNEKVVASFDHLPDVEVPRD